MSEAKVPVNIITGFLGTGKTTLIKNLLRHKPVGEYWAVLVNEFGEIGIDGSFLQGDGAWIKEIPGGCMCCTNGLPMKIALSTLLAKKPHRLLIEPSGVGHPDEILNTLRGEYYEEVVDLRATLTLLDPRKINDTRYTDHEIYNKQLLVADIVLGSKADLCDDACKQAFETWMKNHPQLSQTQPAFAWIEQGQAPLAWLDLPSGYHHEGMKTPDTVGSRLLQTSSEMPLEKVRLNDMDTWICRKNSGQGFYSVGWLFAPTVNFSMHHLLGWVYSIQAERVKGVFRLAAGAALINAENGVVSVSTLDDAADSRVEIIASHPIQHEELQQALFDIAGIAP
ncbi:MAG: GTP-binding protein [Hahellaceae bacterium]|nr:GTP-binding protein [Hahellaceae bacterium]MCP5170390.1 GTP-binding protein [Hahellaceae bacterium]